jgi:uncharacterized membrane protein
MNDFLKRHKLIMIAIYIFWLVIFSLMVLVTIVYTFKFIGYPMNKSEVISTGVALFLLDLFLGIPIPIILTDF